MGSKTNCILCGELTYRNVKGIPTCRDCQSSVKAERDSMKKDVLEKTLSKIDDIAIRQKFLAFVTTRSAYQNLYQRRQKEMEETAGVEVKDGKE